MLPLLLVLVLVLMPRHGLCCAVSVLCCPFLVRFRRLSDQAWLPGETAELFERRRQLLLYALRSPFLDKFVR